MLHLEARGEIEDLKAQDPNWHLEVAKGLTVSNDWLSAAHHFDRYLEHDPDNWEVHFLRAVAYANARSGYVTDLSSLRSYNDALALAPERLDQNVRARLFGYRGAMLKRLGRLDEAENDLLLAQGLATREYEQKDSAYNLACVYAMTKAKEKMMAVLETLTRSGEWKAIIGSRKKYFENYWEDEDFRSLLSLSGGSTD